MTVASAASNEVLDVGIRPRSVDKGIMHCVAAFVVGVGRKSRRYCCR